MPRYHRPDPDELKNAAISRGTLKRAWSLARPYQIPGGGPGSQTISLPGGGTVTPGQQFSETIATPGISTGHFSFRNPTQLYGFNADALCCWCGDYCCGETNSHGDRTDRQK